MVTNLYELPVILDLMLYNQIAVRNDFFNTFKYKHVLIFHIMVGGSIQTFFFFIFKTSLSLTFSL